MTANTLLVIVQTFRAFVFLFAGGMKLFLRSEALAMPIALPLPIVRALGVAGSVGRRRPDPWYLGIRPLLTPLAAAGLLLVVSGATLITMLAEGLAAALFPLVLALLCAALVYGRWPRGAVGSSGKATSAHLLLSVAAMFVVFSPHASSPSMHARSASGTPIVKVQGFRTTSGSARIYLRSWGDGDQYRAQSPRQSCRARTIHILQPIEEQFARASGINECHFTHDQIRVRLRALLAKPLAIQGCRELLARKTLTSQTRSRRFVIEPTRWHKC